jgi:hypothetical protein
MNALLALQEGGAIGQSSGVMLSLQLRIFDSLHKLINRHNFSFLASIHDTVRECFQEHKLLSKFRVFYSLHFHNITSAESLQQLCELCLDKDYLYANEIVIQAYRLLTGLPHAKREESLDRQLKTIFSRGYMEEIPFPTEG